MPLPSISRAALLTMAAAALVSLGGVGTGLSEGQKPNAVVQRLKPKYLYLKTAMDEEEIRFALYAPPPAAAPGSTARPPGGSGTAGPAPASPMPVIVVSGEWGWTPLLQDTASSLALKGRHVLGLDSTAYFRKMLAEPALANDFADFRGIVNEAAGRPKGAPVLLAGFAYGAEMIPYVLNRTGVRGVQGALLISPGVSGAAVYRVAIQLRMAPPPNESFSVEGEYRRLPPIPAVVLEGGDDTKSAGRDLTQALRGPHTYVPIPGADHQFHRMQETYFEQVSNALQWIESQAPWPGSLEGPLPLQKSGASAAPPATGSGYGGHVGAGPGPRATPSPTAPP